MLTSRCWIRIVDSRITSVERFFYFSIFPLPPLLLELFVTGPRAELIFSLLLSFLRCISVTKSSENCSPKSTKLVLDLVKSQPSSPLLPLPLNSLLQLPLTPPSLQDPVSLLHLPPPPLFLQQGLLQHHPRVPRPITTRDLVRIEIGREIRGDLRLRRRGGTRMREGGMVEEAGEGTKTIEGSRRGGTRIRAGEFGSRFNLFLLLGVGQWVQGGA